jgi:rsbT co-antagonist protein RsbR
MIVTPRARRARKGEIVHRAWRIGSPSGILYGQLNIPHVLATLNVSKPREWRSAFAHSAASQGVGAEMTDPHAWSTLDTIDPTALRDLYQISGSDLGHIKAAGEILVPQMDDLVTKWYAWLQTQPEYEQFFTDSEVLSRAQQLQRDYWGQFFAGEIDEAYVEHRRRLGQTHARIGLPLTTYFAGTTRFLGVMGELLAEDGLREEAKLATEQAIGKLLNLDVGIVVETYTRIEKETIEAQSRSLMEMSTPVTEIWNGILLLPLVGIIDSKRAQDIMNAALSKISESHARIFILDISGVGVVDTAVANHLVKITKATRLMGCESTISGVSPAIAQTIVELGIDVGTVKTTATMRDALADAFENLGMQLTELRKDRAR